jgi:hypothetical protein
MDGVGGQCDAPATLPLGKTRYPLYRRLSVPQGRPRTVLFQTIPETEMASFQSFSVPLICSVIIKGTPDTPKYFFHGYKTKDRLKQWSLLEKAVIVLFCRKRQSDIATYYSMVGGLVY